MRKVALLVVSLFITSLCTAPGLAGNGNFMTHGGDAGLGTPAAADMPQGPSVGEVGAHVTGIFVGIGIIAVGAGVFLGGSKALGVAIGATGAAIAIGAAHAN